MLCNAHNVEDKKFTLTEEIFFVMNYLVTSLKKAMLSQIFCQRSALSTLWSSEFRDQVQEERVGGWLLPVSEKMNEKLFPTCLLDNLRKVYFEMERCCHSSSGKKA